MERAMRSVYLVGILCFLLLLSCGLNSSKTIHVYEIRELVLKSVNEYENPYTEVECWVQLKGPDFNKRVYGFWDGGPQFKVRVAATAPGKWSWMSGSNQADDAGLNGQSGTFEAIAWSEIEKSENPNRRGFIQSTPNGHALQYADGMPFFFIGDTWWAASTWRYPFSGKQPDLDWDPSPENLTFENVVHYRKKQGYNSVAMIACYPNWAADEYPAQYEDEHGIGIRQAWEKFGTPTAKDMHDERGNLPFALKEGPMADFDQLNPEYFKSLDKKMDYLASVGFVPFLETIRRDHGPSWKEYFEWPDSFVRYIQYIVARYGAYNLIFSPIHLDWIPPVHSLSGDVFNEAIIAWYETYGPLPYGQPVTTLIDGATHVTYRSGEKVPWLTMHSVGNAPRNHGFYPWLEEQFQLDPPKPTANLEPYYPGWYNEYHNLVVDERPKPDTERDNYFGRTQAWGSLLSGGIAGYIYGTGAYDGTTVGEEKGSRQYIWYALKYPAGEQVGYMRQFIESEGSAYQKMVLASDDLNPRKANRSHPNGLDGWAFMMRTAERDLAFLYFENQCEIPEIRGLHPNQEYAFHWMNPMTGEWILPPKYLKANMKGVLKFRHFPDHTKISTQDWSLKIKLK